MGCCITETLLWCSAAAAVVSCMLTETGLQWQERRRNERVITPLIWWTPRDAVGHTPSQPHLMGPSPKTTRRTAWWKLTQLRVKHEHERSYDFMARFRVVLAGRSFLLRSIWTQTCTAGLTLPESRPMLRSVAVLRKLSVNMNNVYEVWLSSWP